MHFFFVGFKSIGNQFCWVTSSSRTVGKEENFCLFSPQYTEFYKPLSRSFQGQTKCCCFGCYCCNIEHAQGYASQIRTRTRRGEKGSDPDSASYRLPNVNIVQGQYSEEQKQTQGPSLFINSPNIVCMWPYMLFKKTEWDLQTKPCLKVTYRVTTDIPVKSKSPQCSHGRRMHVASYRADSGSGDLCEVRDNAVLCLWVYSILYHQLLCWSMSVDERQVEYPVLNIQSQYCPPYVLDRVLPSLFQSLTAYQWSCWCYGLWQWPSWKETSGWWLQPL